MTKLYSVILAGGSGCRLWPVSREMYPKQMLKFNEEYTLFQKTFLNLANFTDDKNIITVTNIKYVSQIKEQLKILQKKFERKSEYKVLSEPIARNTAPAIALSAKFIKDILNFTSKDAVIFVTPSDHLITNRENFSEIILKGIKLAKEGYIVSFSTETIFDDNTNTNYGYLKVRKNTKIQELEPTALKVTKFVEKPTNDVKSTLNGKAYINSGNYMFTPETILSELKKFEPMIYQNISETKIKTTIPSIQLKEYEEIESISIDYAIMEHTKKLVTIPIENTWKDIGSWEAIYEILPKDDNQNVKIGNNIDIDSKNTLIYSPSKLTATIGLKNKAVITTEDAIFVSDLNDKTGIKTIYSKINEENSKTKQIHQTVYRPWGYYTVYENGQCFLTKCIVVNPDAKLSLQLHHHRSEHWIILEGEATVVKGEETYILNPGESIDIDIEEIHSLQNHSNSQLKVLEIQQGDILDENDIERIEDIYGRV